MFFFYVLETIFKISNFVQKSNFVQLEISTTGIDLKFLTKFRTLHLSTIGECVRSVFSYAPFLVDHKNQFINAIAVHTRNLINDGMEVIMFIEPQEYDDDIFDSKRVLFDCDVNVLERDSVKTLRRKCLSLMIVLAN